MVSRLSRLQGWRRGLGIALAMLATAVASPALAACDALLPLERGEEGFRRALTAADLLQLRDIGRPDGSDVRQPSPLAIAPDGRKAAFVLTRADPATNRYCLGLVVIDLHGGATPRLLDRGGDILLAPPAGPGLVKAIGSTITPAPAWSPDGAWIAYLRRDHGQTQLWRVPAGGGAAQQMTRGTADVEDFAWAADSWHLVIATRPGFAAFARTVADQGAGGWLYDDRFVPYLGVAPRPRSDLPFVVERIDATDGRPYPATLAERALLDLTYEELRLPSARSVDGRRAWLHQEGEGPSGAQFLVAPDRDGRETRCRDPLCDRGIIGLWWDKAGHAVRFLRREGWARDHMALYQWIPGDKPRPILRTEDILIGCLPHDDRLLCLRENSLTPRQIVSVDPETGRISAVFDPNPEFRHIALGSVERLRWRNPRGREARGDLVLPPDYRPGTRLPLIVVQYRSDGFLRGGTGDEYPIQLFAAYGFAVLSVEMAPWVGVDDPGVNSWDAVRSAGTRQWAERWNQLTSLLAGVDMAIARGAVDPDRMGITGLSDGATTARFALINRPIFAAASISTCCVDPVNAMTLAGTAFADDYRAMGVPSLTAPDPDFWRVNTLVLNARTVNRPLLLQVADDELLVALESYTALREQHQPVEMHVFPGEHHIKWQSGHRAAVYARNLDWFRYWLQGRRDPDSAKVGQYVRWDRLRAEQSAHAAK